MIKMTAFDRAWDIVKKDDDYSKFGDKFAAKMKKLREGGRGLPEGTKFSDLRSTSDPGVIDFFGGGMGYAPDGMPFAMKQKYPRENLPSILDLGPSRMMPEEPNMKILREIMSQDSSDDAIDEMERIRGQRDRMAAESAKMRGHVNMPDKLVERARKLSGKPPVDDFETEHFEA